MTKTYHVTHGTVVTDSNKRVKNELNHAKIYFEKQRAPVNMKLKEKRIRKRTLKAKRVWKMGGISQPVTPKTNSV